MPSCARREIVAEAEVGVYHCVARCVRRAFLCGQDALTGRDFEHRRAWLQQRLEALAGVFAIDVLGFAVMANHLHVVLRTRPDIAAGWSDDEVAERWLDVFGGRRSDACPGREDELLALKRAMLLADPPRLAELRRRLASLSWLMRSLAEPLARQANREDDCSGRFWEGRFKCQALLDEAAVLACSVYVDLNPIRAGVAATPEDSQYTSAYERIAARQAEPVPDARTPEAAAHATVPATSPPAASTALSYDAASEGAAGWLAPIADDDARQARAERARAARVVEADPQPDLSGACSAAEPRRPVAQQSAVAQQSTVAPRPPVSRGRRASDRGFLPLELDDYLRLLDWTGRQLRRDCRRAGHGGVIPDHLAPILTRLAIRPEGWLDLVTGFGRWFHRAAGRVGALRERAARRGRRWLHGLEASRAAFV
jgi:REP element-mobilizing transposase RayT